MFSLFNFASIFPGGGRSADAICPYVRTPVVAGVCVRGVQAVVRRLLRPSVSAAVTVPGLPPGQGAPARARALACRPRSRPPLAPPPPYIPLIITAIVNTSSSSSHRLSQPA